MKNVIWLFLFFPAFLLGQEPPSDFYKNTLKTNIASPWIGLQTISLSYERPLKKDWLLEVEGLYTFDVNLLDKDFTLSHILIDLNKNVVSGGLNVIAKKHFYSKSGLFYWASQVGYQRISYKNSHTICTAVNTLVSNICPCLSFEENEYIRNANQLSGGGRIGIQTPISKYSQRFRFDFFVGFSFNYLKANEIGKRSHTTCNRIENSPVLNKEIVSFTNNFSTNFTAKSSLNSSLIPTIGLKLGYAF